ncbi:hypothetical protein [Polaromonas sp.]|uniref:hypothetical protein n=1 Tax=Polaromonas sp. TaxID=1869339 RepID=UPI003566F176
MRLPSRLLLPLLLYPACALALLLSGCSTMDPAAVHRGETRVAPLTSSELAQSDVNRMATLAMRDNLDSLYRLIDKLYRRNPAEWRKTSSVNREAAIERVRSAIDSRTPWPELQGKRDIAALSLALSPEFKGDRVAAFIYASADMLIVAHDGKTTFYLVDGLDAQHIHNAARNVESAVWLLATRRNSAGQPLLLADEISERERNLSFEREFGKMVGRLDLLSEVLTEKYRRAVISYVQNLAGASFLQFLPVR